MIEKYKDYSYEIVTDQDYGISFLNQVPQFMRELACYRLTRGEFGAREMLKLGLNKENTRLLSPAQHMINCMRLIFKNDVLFVSKGIVNNYLVDIIELFCNENDWGIAGCASSGKTFSVAACIVIDWICAPNFTSTYVASTSLDASEDRLWGKVCSLYRVAMKNIKKEFGPDNVIGHLVEYRRMIVYEAVDSKDQEREYTNAIKALAFPRGGEGKKAVENTRGRKNARMRLFIDELAEMDLYTLDTRINLGSNPDFIFGGMANPSNTVNNPHTELCEPADPLKWQSVCRTTHTWRTRTGVALHLSGEDSPNFRWNETKMPPYDRFLTKDSQKATLSRCYNNTNSVEYWRNVYGWWPDASAELTIFTRQFIQSCDIDWKPQWTGVTKVVCGFDTGFTYGGDRCCATYCRIGNDQTGRLVGLYLGTSVYEISVGEVFEDSIARKVVKNCIQYGVKPSDFGMDISGDGGKMLRSIITEWIKFNDEATMIYPISSMGPPSEKRISSVDPRKAKEAYDRKVTEYWFQVHTALSTKSLLGISLNNESHDALISELCFRLYSHKGNKVSIEKKADMRARMKRSPDLADSLTYAVEMLRRAGLEFNTRPENEDSIESYEIERWENKLIYQDDEGDEQDQYGYSGINKDADGF